MTLEEGIAQTLPVSMTLGSLAYFLALLFGITCGGWAAILYTLRMAHRVAANY